MKRGSATRLYFRVVASQEQILLYGHAFVWLVCRNWLVKIPISASRAFTPSKLKHESILSVEARVVKWQTRYFEGVVGASPWRFKSSPAH